MVRGLGPPGRAREVAPRQLNVSRTSPCGGTSAAVAGSYRDFPHRRACVTQSPIAAGIHSISGRCPSHQQRVMLPVRRSRDEHPRGRRPDVLPGLTPARPRVEEEHAAIDIDRRTARIGLVHGPTGHWLRSRGRLGRRLDRRRLWPRFSARTTSQGERYRETGACESRESHVYSNVCRYRVVPGRRCPCFVEHLASATLPG